MSALTPVNQSSTFYRDGRVIGVSLTGEMSVAALNRSDEGVYTCSISGVDSPESWLAVKGPCFGWSVGISPCRTQFFKGESITLYCGAEGRPDGRLLTNSSAHCAKKSHECHVSIARPHHSGAYWCESISGEQGEEIHITVTGGSVILESPVHPVLEGASVTLRCLEFRNNYALTPVNQSSTFYRDGRVIGVSLTGEMSVAALNRSDEGVYTCSISGVDSPESWLAVKGGSVILESPVHPVLEGASVTLRCLEFRNHERFNPSKPVQHLLQRWAGHWGQFDGRDECCCSQQI
ncbi:hypothetical protein NHX12_014168 [Muraenolepis orangiensis]|uniref:Ig-like domain-containing protein n=1 Tax=Muraenolepis orangiensis TaxID=630683 RepID=A0A9Q0DBM5_9TELE|nr:hypothetical protein NHX12_014168 [Muraenolepis orangiensis]